MNLTYKSKIVITVYSVIIILTIITAAVVALLPGNLTVSKAPADEMPIKSSYSSDDYEYYDELYVIRKDKKTGESYILLQNPNYSSCSNTMKARATKKDGVINVHIIMKQDYSTSCVSNGDKKASLYRITSNDKNIDLSKTQNVTLSTKYNDSSYFDNTYSTGDTVAKGSDSIS